jgi:hypothetical protein
MYFFAKFYLKCMKSQTENFAILQIFHFLALK